jgi:hypothetical protein
MKLTGHFSVRNFGQSRGSPHYWIQSLTVDLALHYWSNFGACSKTALTPAMFAGEVGGSNPLAPIELRRFDFWSVCGCGMWFWIFPGRSAGEGNVVSGRGITGEGFKDSFIYRASFPDNFSDLEVGLRRRILQYLSH